MIWSTVIISTILTSPQQHSAWISDAYSKSSHVVALNSQNRVQRVKGFAAGNWVSKWGSFAIVSESGQLCMLTLDGKTKLIANNIEFFGQPGTWSVNPSGTMFATFQSNDVSDTVLKFLAVPDGKTVRSFESTALRKFLGNLTVTSMTISGVAWSKTGRYLAFGHTFKSLPDNGGVAATRTAIVDTRNWKFTDLGEGAPVAWIDDRSLIMISDRSTNEDYKVWVWPKKSSKVLLNVRAVGFDGSLIIAFKRKGEGLVAEKWNKDLTQSTSSEKLDNIALIDVRGVVYFKADRM